MLHGLLDILNKFRRLTPLFIFFKSLLTITFRACFLLIPCCWFICLFLEEFCFLSSYLGLKNNHLKLHVIEKKKEKKERNSPDHEVHFLQPSRFENNLPLQLHKFQLHKSISVHGLCFWLIWRVHNAKFLRATGRERPFCATWLFLSYTAAFVLQIHPCCAARRRREGSSRTGVKFKPATGGQAAAFVHIRSGSWWKMMHASTPLKPGNWQSRGWSGGGSKNPSPEAEVNKRPPSPNGLSGRSSPRGSDGWRHWNYHICNLSLFGELFRAASGESIICQNTVQKSEGDVTCRRTESWSQTCPVYFISISKGACGVNGL